MPSGNLPHRYKFRISGTGVQQQSEVLAAISLGGITGRVRGICVRQEAGGGATSAVFALVGSRQDPTVPLASIPDENIVLLTAAVPLTASATAASLKSVVTPVGYSSSLAIIANVTAGAGAWTLVGYVEVET